MASPWTVIDSSPSGWVAGPLTTDPSAMENALPWHSQMMLPSETPLTMQPWWVQTAVKHLNSPWLGWVMTICSSG